MEFTSAVIAFISKTFSFKKASIAIVSFITSSFLAAGIERLNKIFFKDPSDGVFIHIIIWGFMCAVFFVMVWADFYYGVRVSKKVKKQNFDPSRILDTTVKVIACIMVTFTVAFIGMLSEASKVSFASYPVTLMHLMVWMVLILGDFVSIGCHIESLYGNKPKLFSVVESILKSISKKLIQIFENNSFGFKQNKDEKDTDNNPD